MRKSFFFGMIVCWLLFLTACGTPSPAVSSTESSQPDTQSGISAPSPNVYAPAPDGVSVSTKIDTVLSQAIVTVANNGRMTLDANLHVKFYDAKHALVGSDTIFVEGLAAGNSAFARIDINATNDITMEHKFSHVSLTEGAKNDGGKIDEAASAALTADFDLAFGGAGNPEWAVSWYKYATKIEVYSANSETYALVTVMDGSPKDGIERIGNAIFGNYRNKYGLSSVRLVTPDGETVFTRSAS